MNWSIWLIYYSGLPLYTVLSAFFFFRTGNEFSYYCSYFWVSSEPVDLLTYFLTPPRGHLTNFTWVNRVMDMELEIEMDSARWWGYVKKEYWNKVIKSFIRTFFSRSNNPTLLTNVAFTILLLSFYYLIFFLCPGMVCLVFR